MTGKHSQHLQAILWVAPCIAAWSLIPRLAANTGGLDSFQYLFWSSLVSALSLTLCAVVMGHGPTIRAYSGTDLRRLVALASLGAFGYYALLYSAYAPCRDLSCPQKPLIIITAQYTWPAFSVVWSALLLGERLTRRMVLSLAIGLLAVWCGATGGAAGDAMEKLPVVLVAAAMFGLYSTLLKRIDYEPLSSLAIGFGAATIMSLVAMVRLSAAWGHADWTGIRAVLINGAIVNGLSYVCWYRALRAAPISFVAPWVALTPLLAAMISSSSQPSGDAPWIGIGLVLLSVLLATLPSPRMAEPPPPIAPHASVVEESA